MATTWSTVADTAVKGANTTGTETTLTQSSTEGLALTGLGGLVIHVEAGGALSAGVIKLYIQNPVTGNWNEAPDLQLSVPGGATRYGFPGFAVPVDVSRIAALPSGLGVACDIYIIGARSHG